MIDISWGYIQSLVDDSGGGSRLLRDLKDFRPSPGNAFCEKARWRGRNDLARTCARRTPQSACSNNLPSSLSEDHDYMDFKVNNRIVGHEADTSEVNWHVRRLRARGSPDSSYVFEAVTYPYTVTELLSSWPGRGRRGTEIEGFENKVLRKIFGAKRNEVTGEWRKLHNAELHALRPSPDIIRNIKSRRLRWAGHVARMGEFRNAYRVLVGRPEGKRPLGRPRHRWEDNIKVDLREVGYDGRDWINLARNRDQWRAYVSAAMNLRVP
ncbi:hypothetical protein ANN_15338 [Periplaneta americana]|uniref:Uncharacterized protein n=1 Tax=Periplaneta americana TaxID=6978 RepID=A0ABQ8SGX1_PERAM|nr:hypothetical protein ANN_15338 [Periplaneta americana]